MRALKKNCSLLIILTVLAATEVEQTPPLISKPVLPVPVADKYNTDAVFLLWPLPALSAKDQGKLFLKFVKNAGELVKHAPNKK